MKNMKWLGIALAVLCAASCSNDKKSTETTTEPAKTGVGDFNFIAQQTQITGRTEAPQSSITIINDQGDIVYDTQQPYSTDVYESDIIITEDTTVVTAPPPMEAVSTFTDLTSNVSVRIGRNVYVSVPKTVVARCINLDDFLDNERVCYNLITEEEQFTEEVQKKVYGLGSCVHLTDSSLYIDAFGIGYWCKSFECTLEDAKSPSINLFNIGKLQGTLTSLTLRYDKLGSKIVDYENEYFYRAVYYIKDVEKSETIKARATIIYDKETGSASTCIIYTNPFYTNELADVDFLTSSCRYSQTEPDNMVTLS